MKKKLENLFDSVKFGTNLKYKLEISTHLVQLFQGALI